MCVCVCVCVFVCLCVCVCVCVIRYCEEVEHAYAGSTPRIEKED